jgi:hypothetical protein
MTEARKFPEPQAFSEKPRPAIALTPVVSNQVAAVGYDPETQTLAVQFTSGTATYCYPNVSPETHAAFIGADSIGKFFGQHIKHRPFEKFAPEPPPQEQAQAQA